MAFETLLIDINGDGVGVITLNRPEQLNTFNTALAQELNQALEQMEASQEVRVVVIKGAGRSFCAGIDVGEFFGQTASEYRVWIGRMEASLQTIMSLAKPVIAQVHGVAAANGAGLVSAADLAVAAEDARIGFTAINVGLSCLGPIVPASLSVGRKRALELLYFGELIPAPRALDLGLINAVTPPGELESWTRGYAQKLAAKSPVALQLSKKAFQAAGDMAVHQAFEYMNEAFARLCTTEDAAEGVRAFLEKRQPVWKGR